MMIKLNWGHKLVICMISFMAFVAILVASMMHEKVDLVENNYYEKGIKYDQEIASKTNADQYMDVKFDNSFLTLHNKKSNAVSGSVMFYRPSDENKDFTLPFDVVANRNTLIPVSALDKGLWNIKVYWTDDTGEHLIERELMLR